MACRACYWAFACTYIYTKRIIIQVNGLEWKWRNDWKEIIWHTADGSRCRSALEQINERSVPSRSISCSWARSSIESPSFASIVFNSVPFESWKCTLNLIQLRSSGLEWGWGVWNGDSQDGGWVKWRIRTYRLRITISREFFCLPCPWFRSDNVIMMCHYTSKDQGTYAWRSSNDHKRRIYEDNNDAWLLAFLIHRSNIRNQNCTVYNRNGMYAR